jgi:DNA-binding response OmpR family regulator
MTNNKKILVISSSLIDDELFKRDLFNAGYEAVFATDGFSGVRVASFFKPKLLVLDDWPAEVNLPLACAAIRDLEYQPKLVICTKRYNWRTAKDLGADEVLLKPFGEWQLMSCIDRNMTSFDPSHQLMSA